MILDYSSKAGHFFKPEGPRGGSRNFGRGGGLKLKNFLMKNT